MNMSDPVFQGEENSRPAHEAVPAERSTYLAERVYLVDDDPAVLRVINTMLQISGYDVRAYSSPSEFLTDSEQLPPGVVVTDQVMHQVEGIEVQRRLSARPNHFKVILVTAFPTTSLAVEAMRIGAVTVLDKPFDRVELLAAVKEAFRQLKHADSFNEVLPPVLPPGESYLDRLSLRERDVILLVYKGGTNKSAGIQLGISFKTVEKHRSSAMKKMQVSCIASLVRLLDRDLRRK